MIVGLTSGVWDLIHVGHLHYLESCRALCDKLIVGVDCDDMVRAAKGPKRPYIPEDQRLDLVNSLRWVDAAFLLRRVQDLDDVSKKFHVNRVFKHQGFKNIEGKIWGVRDGVELTIVPDICGLVSTTALAERIIEDKDSLGRTDERSCARQKEASV
jgi:glycerol-3-phosphate cytidylyltransferase